MTDARENRKLPLILVVDDAAAFREMAKDALVASGFGVVLARDGIEGLDVFREVHPDLVLSDLQMPRLDGYSLCQEIRTLSGAAGPPVLMMTASEDLAAVRRAYEAGATDFVTKPVNWELLSYRLRYMLRTRNLIDELEKNRQHLAKAQASARLGNWDLDVKRGKLFCSAMCRRLYGFQGFDGETSIGSLLNMVPPDERERLVRAVHHSVTSGEPLHLDHIVQLETGEERHLHLQGALAFDEDGEPSMLSGTAQDVTDWRLAERQVRFLGHHDSLTSLGNRELFRERVRQALSQPRSDNDLVGVIFLDLDHFKRVNDTLGHEKGDFLLLEVAARLQASVRPSDGVAPLNSGDAPTVSRLGGDEFVISLCHIKSPDEAGLVASRILDLFSEPLLIDDQEVVVGASVGIAIAPQDGEDPDTLLRNADAAMYQAKKEGRNTYRFYEAAMTEQARRRFQLESGLRLALERDQLLLHYQPKVDLATYQIRGFEALVRWQHPEVGMIPPTDFIPVAEGAGLIIRLGDWVMRAACEQARQWWQMGLNPIRVSVNLSAHQFATDDLAEKITRIMAETGVQPEALDLEITESTMMENKDVATRVLSSLKKRGITVSLDDFGTGYSSLSYLKGFPVDTLKIDRSFVSDLATSADDATITAAIISMANTLNLRVVAEGIETQDQLAFLLARGCEEAQGYLFSRPVPAEEATAMLQETVKQQDD